MSSLVIYDHIYCFIRCHHYQIIGVVITFLLSYQEFSIVSIYCFIINLYIYIFLNLLCVFQR